MAAFYIQLKEKLLKISGDLTHDNIVKALGYTPSNFSGNFNDLSDNPFTQNEDGKFNITDEQGNIIATIDGEGIHSVDFIAGEHVLSNKADKSEIPSLKGYAKESWVENQGFAQQSDLENIDFNTLKENPFSDDENGELNVVDENGNVILKVNENGLHTVDVVAGDHILSNKANIADIPSLEGLAKETWVTEYVTKTVADNKVSLDGYATEEYVDNKDFYDIKNNPIINGEEGNLIFVDESGNIGLKLDKDNNLTVADVVAGDHILSNKVDKEEGKQLSTEDFTTALKTKLQSLSNYDDTTITNAINTLREDFDTLVSGDTTTAIKTFNEIIAFLNGVEDTESLEGIIASIEQQIANIEIPSLDGYATESWVESKKYLTKHQDISHLATKTEVSESIADIEFFSIKNNPISDAEEGNLIFVDETGNIGLRIDKDNNLTVADVIAGEHILSNKADKSDLEGLATEKWVNDKNYLTEHQDISHLASEEYVNEQFSNVNSIIEENEEIVAAALNQLNEELKNIEIPSLEEYVKSSELPNFDEFAKAEDIPSIDGLATEEFVTSQGYLTNVPSEYVTDAELNAKNYATKYELDNKDFYEIQNNPIVNDGNGKIVFVDETGNIGLQLESDNTLYVKDVISGEHILSNKQNVLISGSNIKTINGQSILGSGDITISGGSGNTSSNVQAVDEISTIIDVDLDKYIVETTDDNITLDNNKYYKKTNVSSNIIINLNMPEDNTVFTSFSIEFTTSSSGTSVSLPDTIKWLGGELPTFENDFTYQISICNGLGVCAKYA